MTDQSSDDNLLTAHDSGRRARIAGKDLADNPYPPGIARRKWYEGWCEANLRIHLAAYQS